MVYASDVSNVKSAICCCIKALTTVYESEQDNLPTNQLTVKSSRGLVNSRASQLAEMFDLNLEYIIALSVISNRLHCLYTANIKYG